MTRTGIAALNDRNLSSKWLRHSAFLPGMHENPWGSKGHQDLAVAKQLHSGISLMSQFVLPWLRDVEHPFSRLLICDIFFGEMSTEVFGPCLNRLLVFFLSWKKHLFTYSFMRMSVLPARVPQAWLGLCSQWLEEGVRSPGIGILDGY